MWMNESRPHDSSQAFLQTINENVKFIPILVDNDT